MKSTERILQLLLCVFLISCKTNKSEPFDYPRHYIMYINERYPNSQPLTMRDWTDYSFTKMDTTFNVDFARVNNLKNRQWGGGNISHTFLLGDRDSRKIYAYYNFYETESQIFRHINRTQAHDVLRYYPRIKRLADSARYVLNGAFLLDKYEIPARPAYLLQHFFNDRFQHVEPDYKRLPAFLENYFNVLFRRDDVKEVTSKEALEEHVLPAFRSIPDNSRNELYKASLINTLQKVLTLFPVSENSIHNRRVFVFSAGGLLVFVTLTTLGDERYSRHPYYEYDLNVDYFGLSAIDAGW